MPVNTAARMAAAERRTQEERSATTRQAVLDATIECLIEFGYRGTTTTAIQQRAGVSRGALTHQFPFRNELLAAAITHLAEVRATEMLAAVPALPSGGDHLEAGIRALWATFNTDLFQAAIELWVASRTDDDLHRTLIAAEREIARQYHRAGRAMFGDLAALDGFGRGMEAVVTHMRGAALTGILRRSAKDEETIGDCMAIMQSVLSGGAGR
ncbi:MAG TPA: TetR/AcrR family transcriptional regulator [Acidimicrobiia bacterium]|nr:TetR/AcrR family transcriptional regulator [Acidimicrobiia bacterium]